MIGTGKGLIILGHGSRREEANKVLIDLVENLKYRLGTELIVGAFFSMARPDLQSAVMELVRMGCSSILIQPFFLVRGHHIVRDIPEVIEECSRMGEHIAIELLEPLGDDAGLIDIMEERLSAKIGCDLYSKNVRPDEIEMESMALVERGLKGFKWEPELMPLVKRVVHTTADFSFAHTLIFSPGAVQAGKVALKSGCKIITDVEMVRAGISGKLGNEVLCKIGDDEVFHQAKSNSTTRASAAMGLLAPEMDGSIVAIGNSPTALERVLDLAQHARVHPALIIGVPVGFVGAAKAKLRLAGSGLPHVTNSGPRGGSPVAAALVNALIYNSDKA